MSTVNLKATGANIKSLMIKNGVSVGALQKILGFSTKQAIYKWRRGETKPTIDNLVILADVFNCKLDDIVIVDK